MKHIEEYKTIDFGTKYNFNISSCDTDSIKITNADGSPISDEDIAKFQAELNALLPEKINFELDGIYRPLAVVKAKNYAYVEDGKRKIKGSALKASSREKILKKYSDSLLDSILGLEPKTLEELYHDMIKQVINIKDITPWCSKKTFTKAVKNETTTSGVKLNIIAKKLNLQEGDKFLVYFKSDDSYGIPEEFDGDYHVDRMLEKVFKTTQIVSTIMDLSWCLNYKLKRNKKKLEELCMMNE